MNITISNKDLKVILRSIQSSLQASGLKPKLSKLQNSLANVITDHHHNYPALVNSLNDESRRIFLIDTDFKGLPDGYKEVFSEELEKYESAFQVSITDRHFYSDVDDAAIWIDFEANRIWVDQKPSGSFSPEYLNRGVVQAVSFPSLLNVKGINKLLLDTSLHDAIESTASYGTLTERDGKTFWVSNDEYSYLSEIESKLHDLSMELAEDESNCVYVFGWDELWNDYKDIVVKELKKGLDSQESVNKLADTIEMSIRKKYSEVYIDESIEAFIDHIVSEIDE